MQNNYYVRNKKDIRVQPNKTIYLPYDNFINNYGSSGSISIRVYFYDKSKNYIGNFKTFTNFEKNRWKTNTPSNCYYIRFYCSGIGTTYNNDIIISYFDTSYTPHQQQTFIFPLGNEKLMLGDYLADDGIHHVRGKYIFTGSETWNFYSASAAKFGIILPNVKNEGQNINPSFLCTQYRSLSWDALGNNSPNNLISITSANMIRFRNTSIDTLENWTQYITEQYNNGTPVIIEYPLNEEVIVPYTSAQQEVYNQIKQALSYEEQTNISSNTIALFNAEAYQSTKLVLEERDAKYESLEARVALLE